MTKTWYATRKTVPVFAPFISRTMAEAFNEWMRRFVADPHAFEQEWRTVSEFVAQDAGSFGDPDYGSDMAAFLRHLMHGELPLPKKRKKNKRAKAGKKSRR